LGSGSSAAALVTWQPPEVELRMPDREPVEQSQRPALGVGRQRVKVGGDRAFPVLTAAIEDRGDQPCLRLELRVQLRHPRLLDHAIETDRADALHVEEARRHMEDPLAAGRVLHGTYPSGQ
jgi:hypothetical protein